MVQRAAGVGRGIRTSSGQKERSGHPSAPWTKSWPSLPGGVSQGKGPLQGGLGKRLLTILAQAGEGLGGVGS